MDNRWAKKSKVLQDQLQDWNLLGENEPSVCGFFGCGRRLTLNESLYGGVCCVHNYIQPIEVVGSSPEEFAIVLENGKKVMITSKQYGVLMGALESGKI